VEERTANGLEGNGIRIWEVGERMAHRPTENGIRIRKVKDRMPMGL